VAVRLTLLVSGNDAEPINRIRYDALIRRSRPAETPRGRRDFARAPRPQLRRNRDEMAWQARVHARIKTLMRAVNRSSAGFRFIYRLGARMFQPRAFFVNACRRLLKKAYISLIY
jgi:hypothetical protein